MSGNPHQHESPTIHRRHAELISNPSLEGTTYDRSVTSSARTGTDARDIADLADIASRHTSLSSTTIPPARHSAGLHDKDEWERLIPTSYAYAELDASSANTNDAQSSPTPVPVTVIFSRNAAPLYLPQLDKCLAKFSSPPFVPHDENSMQMFPLMDKLTKSGMTIDDLESNDKLVPVWRYRKNVLGAILSAAIGILVSGDSRISTLNSNGVLGVELISDVLQFARPL